MKTLHQERPLHGWGYFDTDLYELIEAVGGHIDVDDWFGSAICEWWSECQDGREMLAAIHRCGMRPIVNPIATADEIRVAVSCEEFLKAAFDHVDASGWLGTCGVENYQ